MAKKMKTLLILVLYNIYTYRLQLHKSLTLQLLVKKSETHFLPYTLNKTGILNQR